MVLSVSALLIQFWFVVFGKEAVLIYNKIADNKGRWKEH